MQTDACTWILELALQQSLEWVCNRLYVWSTVPTAAQRQIYTDTAGQGVTHKWRAKCKVATKDARKCDRR